MFQRSQFIYFKFFTQTLYKIKPVNQPFVIKAKNVERSIALRTQNTAIIF